MSKWLRKIFPLLLAALVLTGCGGKSLPAGMEEQALVEAGRAVVVLLGKGDYEAVYQAFREDVRESTSVEAVRDLALTGTDGAGVYKQIDSFMTTGQTVGGTSVGVAVFYCDFSEDDVLIRVSFDDEMALVGLSIRKQ